jgi:hypothetical protein
MDMEQIGKMIESLLAMQDAKAKVSYKGARHERTVAFLDGLRSCDKVPPI